MQPPSVKPPLDKKKQKKPKFIWRTSAARNILLYDLETGKLSLNENETSTHKAWQTYSKYSEFASVEYPVFEHFLKEYRTKGTKKAWRAFSEEVALSKDRQLHPRQYHNEKGEPVFDMDLAAKKHLRGDVEKKLHEKMKPAELQASRAEYKPFKPKIFKDRIKQEVRYQKYCNYLNEKRWKLLQEDKKNKNMMRDSNALKDNDNEDIKEQKDNGNEDIEEQQQQEQDNHII